MQLEDFPRPKNDNGLGLHWSASVYHPSGAHLEFWIDELRAMDIKWVKLLDDGGGSSLEVCQRLLEADIMPIVRMWRNRPNPGHLTSRQVDAVRRLIAAGVRYFETNNEPDLAAEWRNQSQPEDWLDVVAANFVWDADTILGLGGLPAVPAMGPGSKDNLLKAVLARRRGDLFEKGVWLAIHNYALNHPPDYPDDEVNQKGRALTPGEYAELARWACSGRSYDEVVGAGVALSEEDYFKFNNWAWDWRSLSMVNQVRALNANPGDTVFDDPSCFRGWEVAGRMVEDTLGFSLPVISTEGGPVVGWGDDNRYAKVNPETHMAWQLEIARFFDERAPSWYFACCTWLIAANRIGHVNPTWDQMAWYTHAWDLQFGLQGQLPVVQALKDRNKGTSVIEGVIRTAAGRPVGGLSLELWLGDRTAQSGRTASDGTFRFRKLRAGRYSLHVVGHGPVQQSIELGSEETLPLHLWLPTGCSGVIEACVRDEFGGVRPGLMVTLRDPQEAEQTQVSDERGSVRFGDLAAGVYRVRCQGVTVGGILIDGWGTRLVDVVLPGPARYRYAVVTKRLLSPEETGNRRAFFGTISDAQGVPLNGIVVEMSWKDQNPTDQSPRVASGADPFKPKGYYEFLHTPGEFQLRVVQGDWESEVAEGLVTAGLPGREQTPVSYQVDFRLMPLDAGSGSARIDGCMPGAAVGQEIRLHWGPDSSATVADSAGLFAFEDLAPGRYSLEVVGLGMVASGVDLEAEALFHFELPMLGVLEGQARGEPQPTAAVLRSERWNLTRTMALDGEGIFRFGKLPAGPYVLEVAGQQFAGLWVTGNGTQTFFVIETKRPAAGRIVGRVLSESREPVAGAAVDLMLGDALIASVSSGADGAFGFDNLTAGEYCVAVRDRGASVHVLVDGLSIARPDDIVLPPLPVEAPVKHYYLLGRVDDTAARTRLLLALEAIIRNEATAGYSVDEARQAGRITILGDEASVSAEAERALREHGREVTRVQGDAYAMGRALAECAE